MSRETIEWLNNNVLMGYVGDRSKWAGQGYASIDADGTTRPWFVTAGDAGWSGGFDGPVPIDDVVSRLFHWDAVEAPVSITLPAGLDSADGIDADGNPYRRVDVSDRKAIVREDTGHVMGLFKSGYRVHQFREWLIDNVGAILDDDVCIDSAGLLKGGAIAWVSVSLGEHVVTAEDFAVRPRILAYTSHDGTHATTYSRSVNAPVCDNSLDVEIAGADGRVVKVRHSARSLGRVQDARDALGILYRDAEESAEFFHRLAEWEVTNREFLSIIERLDPVPAAEVSDGKVTNTRAINAAETRHAEMAEMYVNDHRAAPWQGSALGVLQALNTWDQQVRSVRGERVERQMAHTLSGKVGEFDARVMELLGEVCDPDGSTRRLLVGS